MACAACRGMCTGSDERGAGRLHGGTGSVPAGGSNSGSWRERGRGRGHGRGRGRGRTSAQARIVLTAIGEVGCVGLWLASEGFATRTRARLLRMTGDSAHSQTYIYTTSMHMYWGVLPTNAWQA